MTPASATSPSRLTIVVPFFNEGANVQSFFARMVPALNGLGLTWDVVCVNDGSSDDTLDRLLAARARHPAIKVVDLSRNFGKERALSAGLSHATGDAVVIIDADLQHPPERIADMIEKWRGGYEVVYAVREERMDQGLMARVLRRIFYALFDRLSEVPVPHGTGDFRLLDRRVVAVINRMPERTRFMKGIYSWVGFRQGGISYREEERREGETKWGLGGLLRLGVDGLTAFSNFPLRVWTIVGATISGFAFLYIIFRLIRTALHGVDVPGYESIIMIVLFLGGIQLLTLGILGDYIGRIFSEVKGRPLFIVRATYGVDDGPDEGWRGAEEISAERR